MRIAHVIARYLPPSQTFISTQLDAQNDLTQMVFSRERLGGAVPPGRLWTMNRAGGLLERASRRAGAARLGFEPFRLLMPGPVGRFRPDVLHAHFGWAGLDALPSAAATGVPLVTAFHGRDVYSPLHRLGGAGDLYQELFRTGYAFTCVGPRAGEELVRAGCPSERLHIVPVGLRLSDFEFRPVALDGVLRVMQVARLVPKKGVDLSIRAFALARSELPETEFTIVGDGPEREPLERLARELKVDDAVSFVGEQPPAAVRGLIARSHVGLQPSRVADDGDREGTPTVIIEMQAMGVEVVATNHADISFVVPDAGQLVEEEDVDGLARRLVETARRPADERHLRLRAARDLVERQHDARSIATKLRAIYTAGARDAGS